MQRCEQVGLKVLNFHPGSHLNKISVEECLDKVAESINLILGKTCLLYTSGSGYMYLCASRYQGDFPEKEYAFFNRGISGNTLRDLEKRWEEADDIKCDDTT